MIFEHTEYMDRYSACVDDLEMLSCFLNYQKTREFSRKTPTNSRLMCVMTSWLLPHQYQHINDLQRRIF